MYNETTKHYTTVINLNNITSETKLGKWYPIFRLSNSRETGYCGTFLIGVNRNNTSGYPVSYAYILTIGHTTRISGNLLNYTNSTFTSNNQLVELRVRTDESGSYKYIEGFISEGGNSTNSYYIETSILVQRQSAISINIQTYTDPEPLDDNITGTINWTSGPIYYDPVYNVESSQIFNMLNKDTLNYRRTFSFYHSNGSSSYDIIFTTHAISADLSMILLHRYGIFAIYVRGSTTVNKFAHIEVQPILVESSSTTPSGKYEFEYGFVDETTKEQVYLRFGPYCDIHIFGFCKVQNGITISRQIYVPPEPEGE